MSHCTPALQNAIWKSNLYCEKLKRLAPQDCSILIPQKLSLLLSEIRDNSNIIEDVWIEVAPIPSPPWLVNLNIRKGISTVLEINHTEEEALCIGWKANNLSCWFVEEAVSIQISASLLESSSFFSLMG